MTDTHPASTDTPACQSCGGEIQGWTCQGCGRTFRENDAGKLVVDRPAPIEPGVRQDLLADWIKAREEQARRGALQLNPTSPARYHVSGKEAAFREIGAALWNSPEWFASEIALLSSNTGER